MLAAPILTVLTSMPVAIRIAAIVGGLGVLSSPEITVAAPATPALVLSDIAIPAGRQLIGTTQGSLLESATDIIASATRDLFASGDSVVDGDDPINLGDTGLSITFIRYRSANNLQISENGAGNFEALYSVGGTYETRQFHIQVDADTVVTLEASNIEAAGSAANRIRWSLRAQQQTDLQLLDVGSRWIHFITEPETIEALSVELPVLIGGLGSLAAPMATVAGAIIPASIEVPAFVGGLGSLAAVAIDMLAAAVITPADVEILAMTGGLGVLAEPEVTVAAATTAVITIVASDGSLTTSHDLMVIVT